MKVRTVYIMNGDRRVPFKIYTCEQCGRELNEMCPREIIENKVYCGDCAFKLNLISEQEFIKNHCFSIGIKGLRAAVHDERIHLGTGKFPWERISRDRNGREYAEWRTAVFSRDNYTCQLCGQVGGKLNAHHIKSYKDYTSDRYKIDNGVTLCEKCHRKVHRDKNSEWIYIDKPKHCRE